MLHEHVFEHKIDSDPFYFVNNEGDHLAGIINKYRCGSCGAIKTVQRYGAAISFTYVDEERKE